MITNREASATRFAEASRTINIKPQELREYLQQARKREKTKEFKAHVIAIGSSRRKPVSACYLFMLQCSYWVNLRRPASRDIAGHQSYTSE